MVINLSLEGRKVIRVYCSYPTVGYFECYMLFHESKTPDRPTSLGYCTGCLLTLLG